MVLNGSEWISYGCGTAALCSLQAAGEPLARSADEARAPVSMVTLPALTSSSSPSSTPWRWCRGGRGGGGKDGVFPRRSLRNQYWCAVVSVSGNGQRQSLQGEFQGHAGLLRASPLLHSLHLTGNIMVMTWSCLESLLRNVFQHNTSTLV